eukprot:Clim_evm21s8 gene=Clim_evmTU21s8
MAASSTVSQRESFGQRLLASSRRLRNIRRSLGRWRVGRAGRKTPEYKRTGSARGSQQSGSPRYLPSGYNSVSAVVLEAEAISLPIETGLFGFGSQHSSSEPLHTRSPHACSDPTTRLELAGIYVAGTQKRRLLSYGEEEAARIQTPAKRRNESQGPRQVDASTSADVQIGVETTLNQAHEQFTAQQLQQEQQQQQQQAQTYTERQQKQEQEGADMVLVGNDSPSMPRRNTRDSDPMDADEMNNSAMSGIESGPQDVAPLDSLKKELTDAEVEEVLKELGEEPVYCVLEMVVNVIKYVVMVNQRSGLPTDRYVTHFHSSCIPSIDILNYMRRFARYAPCTADVYLYILIYFDRALQANPSMVATLYNVHRLAITAFVIACKWSQDRYFTNSHYAKIGGLPVEELNHLELELLQEIKFDLYVSRRAIATIYRLVKLQCTYSLLPSPAQMLVSQWMAEHEHNPASIQEGIVVSSSNSTSHSGSAGGEQPASQQNSTSRSGQGSGVMIHTGPLGHGQSGSGSGSGPSHGMPFPFIAGLIRPPESPTSDGPGTADSL